MAGKELFVVVAGDDLVPPLIEAEISTEEFRRNWARLILTRTDNPIHLTARAGYAYT